MNPAQKALWFIESHLADALTLDEIAAIGGISCPHCGQGVASDAFTFSRLIFRRAGIRGILSRRAGFG